MKSYRTKHGFTLIEFIIAMTIFFIVSALSYIPYNHYQKKWHLRQGVKEITQSLYEARNLSINGLNSGSGHLAVGVYFDTTEWENTHITYFSYPHSFTGTQITNSQTPHIRIERTKDLPVWVQIDSVAGKSKFLVYFESISWKGRYYFWDSVTKEEFSSDEIDIDISYKWATSPSLKKQIKYYTKWNIADY